MDTIRCPSCQAKVVPRMVVRDGRPDAGYCPLCGTLVRDFTGEVPAVIVLATMFVEGLRSASGAVSRLFRRSR